LTKRGDVKNDGSLKRSETTVFSRQKPRNPSGPLNRPNPDAFIKEHISNIYIYKYSSITQKTKRSFNGDGHFIKSHSKDKIDCKLFCIQ
jgi:hypothetical protein